MSAPRSLRALYDPESFRRDGHEIVDRLADWLTESLAGSVPVARLLPLDVLARAFPTAPADDGGGDWRPLLERILEEATRLHHPRCMGHQVAPPLPLAALFDLVIALGNNGMAVHEMGQTGVILERRVVQWLSQRLGWDRESCGGVLTSGGSLGNLTALLAARQTRAGFDAWSEGIHAGPPLAVLAGGGAHYSIDRAARIMGLGHGGVVTIDTDTAGRIVPEACRTALARARDSGRRVFAIVASSCSTSLGAFDPLDEIVAFAKDEGLWCHVDGAHGAAVALSQRHRHLLRGVEEADSVVWDAHKMLMMPALVTAVLYRDGSTAARAFSQEAEYLFAGAGDEWQTPAHRTFECTKRSMSLLLWSALVAHGETALAEVVDVTFDRAREFAGMIDAAPDFELAAMPEANIVCYRYLSGTDDDAVNEAIRARLLTAGDFYVVRTRARGRTWLRSTFMNPLIETRHLEELIATIREAAHSRSHPC